MIFAFVVAANDIINDDSKQRTTDECRLRCVLVKWKEAIQVELAFLVNVMLLNLQSKHLGH